MYTDNSLISIKATPDGKADMDLVRLSQIPSFVPVMQAGSDKSDIVSRLDHAPLSSMLQRYEDHLRMCATLVAAEQVDALYTSFNKLQCSVV